MATWRSLAEHEQIVLGVGHLVQPGEMFESELDLSDRPDAFERVQKKADRTAGGGD